MKSHVYFVVEVKEFSENNWEASFNVGNGRVSVMSTNMEDAIKRSVDGAFSHKPKEAA